MEKPSLDKFFGIPGTLNAELLLKQLDQEVFSVADAGYSLRLIKSRERAGLLSNDDVGKGAKLKFDFTEFVWLTIMSQLREIGISFKLIKAFKDAICFRIPFKWMYRYFNLNRQLLANIPDDDPEKEEIIDILDSGDFEELDGNSKYTILHLLIGETIITGKPLSILLFKDGYWLPWSDTGDYAQCYGEEELKRKAFEMHTTISLSNIVKDFLASDKLAYAIPRLNILNENELKILELIGSGDYKSVTINFKNKKMKSLELIKEQSVKRKVVDILSDNAYQDIVIKSHKGIVTHIQNTVKVIFDR